MGIFKFSRENESKLVRMYKNPETIMEELWVPKLMFSIVVI